MIAAAFLMGAAAPADAIRIYDLKGRLVILDKPVRKVLLGEGRYLAILALLTKDPVSRVAGMFPDFETQDHDGFARFADAYPLLAEAPTIDGTGAGSVTPENALDPKPDTAILGLGGHSLNDPSKQAIELLTAAGVPIIIIDFRNIPIVNTRHSMHVLGQIFGLQAESEDFVDFYNREVSRVTDRMVLYSGHLPTVFLDVKAGLTRDCCFTTASSMLATLIDVAGGRNIAKSSLRDMAKPLKPEFIIASNPDIYIGTAIGSRSQGWTPGGPIVLGAGIDKVLARQSLISATLRPGISSLSTVDTGHTHAIWHQFASTPMNVYALQKLATWLHPELFGDLDPEKTMMKLVNRLLPIRMEGVYATSVLPPTKVH